MLKFLNKLMSFVCYTIFWILGFIICVTILSFFLPSARAEAFEPNWREVVVHHTATPKYTKSGDPYPEFTKEVCDRLAVDRGWDECGYNFLIQRNGTIHNARELNKPGAHCPTMNKVGIGIAFVMDGRFEKPTQKALNAFKNIKSQLEKAFNTELPISGHRNHRATICPTDALWNAVNQ